MAQLEESPKPDILAGSFSRPKIRRVVFTPAEAAAYCGGARQFSLIRPCFMLIQEASGRVSWDEEATSKSDDLPAPRIDGQTRPGMAAVVMARKDGWFIGRPGQSGQILIEH
jgi:hypothetical protein